MNIFITQQVGVQTKPPVALSRRSRETYPIHRSAHQNNHRCTRTSRHPQGACPLHFPAMGCHSTCMLQLPQAQFPPSEQQHPAPPSREDRSASLTCVGPSPPALAAYPLRRCYLCRQFLLDKQYYACAISENLNSKSSKINMLGSLCVQSTIRGRLAQSNVKSTILSRQLTY